MLRTGARQRKNYAKENVNILYCQNDLSSVLSISITSFPTEAIKLQRDRLGAKVDRSA